jgi:DNA-binding helix-hairpin-helix protein with protein kinase domain
MTNADSSRASLAASLCDHDGRPVELGDKLGTGGEGSVFAVLDRGDAMAAKLYHEPLLPEKHAKLASMVAGASDALRGISAWPHALLHAGSKGPVCGFLMPRLFEHAAIHNIYGPAHRKAMYPKADWAFLVQVARNVAAAFDTIHAHGHVIGDVNQGNVYVGSNALVKLIDCDSFQIAANHTLFACEVGVPHFTPPELQRIESFRNLTRNVHHDNFGLAVLIFHLLFMGRHPFAGVYAGTQDMPIERAIKEFRYAFARGAYAYDMARPPGSVGPEIVTAELAGLFEHAFRHGNDQLERPQARQWVQALDALKREIRACGEHALHRYHGKLNQCPWCDLERREQLVFFTQISNVEMPEVRDFNLRQVWQEIEAAAAKTAAVPLPVRPDKTGRVPAPLPLAVQAGRIAKMVMRIVVLGIPLLLIFRWPVGTLAWSLGGFWGWQLIGRWHSPVERERERRKVVLAVADEKWKEVQRRWQDLPGEQQAKHKLMELRLLQRDYRQWRSDYDKARSELQLTLRQRQLQRFLARFHLDTANIAEVSTGHKITLTTFGIETAADINAQRLASVRGLTKVVIERLLQWRMELERWSQLEFKRANDSAELKTLRRQFMQRRRKLAATLSAGPEELKRLAAALTQQRNAMQAGAQQAADALAQARIDCRF